MKTGAGYGRVEQDGWREVDAAQAALLALQERTLVLLRRALDLVDLAVDASPDLREFGAELHGEASALLADVDVELANLGEALGRLRPDAAG